MAKNIRVGNVVINTDYALKVGKADWSKEHAHEFGGDETKASAAYDAFLKQHEQNKKEESEQIANAANAGKAKADAKKKLEARDNPKANAAKPTL